jgi:hypothetical protein
MESFGLRNHHALENTSSQIKMSETKKTYDLQQADGALTATKRTIYLNNTTWTALTRYLSPLDLKGLVSNRSTWFSRMTVSELII